MREANTPDLPDVKALWRGQPEEDIPTTPPLVLERRARQMAATTRQEILSSLGAIVFFAAVLVWRTGLSPFVAASLGLMAAWFLISLYRQRRWLWSPPQIAASGLDFYRAGLQQRRKHLLNIWLWHGPLLLSCLTLFAVIVGGAPPAFRRLGEWWPLAVVLAASTGFSIWRRHRQAAEIERELDELANQ